MRTCTVSLMLSIYWQNGRTVEYFGQQPRVSVRAPPPPGTAHQLPLPLTFRLVHARTGGFIQFRADEILYFGADELWFGSES